MNKVDGSCGYFSSYDRGLLCLLVMWPKIRDQVPHATLSIAYGWDMYVKVRGEDEYYRVVSSLIERLKDQGVTDYGRLSHKKLADLMKRTQVWTYPTEWTETCCITALKAQEAGMWPVTTPIAALNETVRQGDMVSSLNIYSNEFAQSKFVDYVVTALNKRKTSEPVPDVGWDVVADKWLKEAIC